LKMGFFLASAIVATALFNNCSNSFQPLGDLSSQQSTSSLPPGSGAPGPQLPNQPGPAPLQPIVLNNNPLWMAGKSLNEWIEIPNTAGAGGAAIDAFSGLALREATSELVIGAAGGHGDGTDNRVVSLVLEADQPKWILRIAGSLFPEYDVSHYKDGTPSARHTYQHNYYVESLHRLFLVGARFTAGGLTRQYPDLDAFSFETNQWDPPGTWAPLPPGSAYGAVKVPGSDDIFTSSLHKWSAAEATSMYKMGKSSSASVWSTPITVRTDTAIRWPLAYDKSRNQLFNLQMGDGQGYDLPTVYASRIDLATNVQTKVSIKPSPAYDTFQAEKPAYAAMDYDPENDRFLFYSGLDTAAGRVYVIKPSTASNEWEMSLLQTTATSVKPPATTPAGLNSNFKYVPRLKGFVLLPRGSSNLFFLKTAQ
jgi:hypothetical protein